MEKANCPRCGRRLFDFAPGSSGTIVIKCPRCKTVVAVTRAPEPTYQRQASAQSREPRVP